MLNLLKAFITRPSLILLLHQQSFPLLFIVQPKDMWFIILFVDFRIYLKTFDISNLSSLQMKSRQDFLKFIF